MMARLESSQKSGIEEEKEEERLPRMMPKAVLASLQGFEKIQKQE
jgi:hypothetical protein